MKKFFLGIIAVLTCTLLSVQLAHSINTNNLDDFLLSNVEALSQSETHDRQSECYNNGGNWNMASQASEGNCCTKQGLFSGENQLA